MIAVITFLYSLRAWIGRLWRNDRAQDELIRTLHEAERIIRLKPGFDPDIVTIHPDRITLEGDTASEFVRSGRQWLQVPTDDDVERMADQLGKVGYLDDAFLAELRYSRRIAWDDHALLEASVAATAEQAKRRRRARPEPHLLN